jgi:hypothetical protein
MAVHLKRTVCDTAETSADDVKLHVMNEQFVLININIQEHF